MPEPTNCLPGHDERGSHVLVNVELDEARSKHELAQNLVGENESRRLGVSKILSESLQTSKRHLVSTLEEYCKLFCEREHDAVCTFDCKSLPWAAHREILPTSAKQEMQEEINEELEKVVQVASQQSNKLPLQLFAEDSDGDDVRLCKCCNLPVGDVFYRRGRHLVHGECEMQIRAEEIQTTDNERQRTCEALNERQHADYGIGWDVRQIPRNSEAASKLAMRDVSEGMVCVVMDEDGESIRLGSALAVTGAINLEYLSTALKLRRSEGTEPVFSLDAVDPSDIDTMFAKKYSPEWLANTKVGEVLFQADYHLKELCMGARQQPVVGMKSSCEHELEDERTESGWKARAWFVVRKAEVLISESNMLVPFVRMGVEAREQVMNGSSVVDKVVTRPDHPLLKYAEAFTRNFDLIAERKSVIYHLRELAKASVLAKYLIESGANLQESWFHLTAFPYEAVNLEVPQLWRDRYSAKIHVRNGRLSKKTQYNKHSVYGGVKFGLENFTVDSMRGSRVPRLSSFVGMSVGRGRFGFNDASLQFAGRPHSKLAAASATLSASHLKTRLPLARFPVGGASPVAAAASLSTSLSTRLGALPSARFPFGGSASISTSFPASSSRSQVLSFKPSLRLPAAQNLSGRLPFAQNLSGRPPFAHDLPSFAQAERDVQRELQGVDLRLDKFALSQATRVAPEASVCSWDQVKSLDECAAIGSAFFSALDSSDPIFKDDDLALFKSVFNPVLSDRRNEGDMFIPPDASFTYLGRLRHLVKEEDLVRQKRQDCFISEAFTIANPGSLFPESWTPMNRGDACLPHSSAQGHLRAHPENKLGLAALRPMLNLSKIVFDKSTEEGRRFRIYRLGKLEVRTLQDVEGDEELGMIFSMVNASLNAASHHCVSQSEKITSATEYVERAFCSGEDASKLGCRYYLVCQTEKGHNIFLERCAWVENPVDLDILTSFGKVTRSQKAIEGVTVQHMKALQADPAKVSLSDKRFIQAAFLRVVGQKGVKLSQDRCGR